MAKWFVRRSNNTSAYEKCGLKIVHLDIGGRKPFSKLVNDVSNDKIFNEQQTTTSKRSNSRGNAIYYDKIDVVDVKTLKYDIKKLLQDSNTKIAHEKLGKVLRSVDMVSKRCEDMTSRLSKYEDRIKCLENRSTSLTDKNKQLELKIRDLEQFVSEAEILNENLKNVETAKKIYECNEPVNLKTAAEYEEEKRLSEMAESSIDKATGEMRVKIILWQMKQKIRATYKYKSKESKLLLNKDENLK